MKRVSILLLVALAIQTAIYLTLIVAGTRHYDTDAFAPIAYTVIGLYAVQFLIVGTAALRADRLARAAVSTDKSGGPANP